MLSLLKLLRQFDTDGDKIFLHETKYMYLYTLIKLKKKIVKLCITYL